MGNSCINPKDKDKEQQHQAFIRYHGLDKVYESLAVSENELDECPICLSESPTSYLPIVETRLIKFPECNHVMHDICLLNWFRHTRRPSCPMCRNKMKGVKFVYYDDGFWI
uniref:Zinc finger RING2 n=1 Tax=Clandestinovirus TaxID=2831644 RepID=A0A8F8KTC9_9VIRU|nr:zinc finger RING2 [Clandestinovirus]